MMRCNARRAGARQLRPGSWLGAALVVAGCLKPSPPATLPTYNLVYGVSSHNSYWMNRSDQQDWFSSGVQETLSDQLLHDHVRAIELDLHSNGAPEQDWLVYHTSRAEDSVCRTLSDCLEALRKVQYALPEHDVINVVLELKNVDPLTDQNYCHGHSIRLCNGPSDLVTDRQFTGGGHTVQALDELLRAHLGAALYTPGDFLARCPGMTMVACAAKVGWPTVDQLRGKFIVNIKGDWSSAVTDWVQYATTDIQHRVAFPVACIDSIRQTPTPNPQDQFFETVTGDGKVFRWFSYTPTLLVRVFNSDWAIPRGAIPGAQLHAALDASVFWQVEDPDGAPMAVAEFLQNKGVVQGKDSYDYHPGCDGQSGNCQEGRLATGIQFLHTDYPWHVVNDGGPGIPTDPSQRLKTASWAAGQPQPTAAIHEPGARLYFHVPWPAEAVYAFQDQIAYNGPSVFRYAEVPASSQRWWETTVSTTRNGATWRTDPGAPSLKDNYASDYLLPCPYPSGEKLVGPSVLDLDPSDPQNCSDFPRVAQANGQGCIQVASASGNNWIAVCRQKNSGGGANGGGASFFQEAVRIFVFEVRDGAVVDRPIDPSGGAPQFFSASRYSTCAVANMPHSEDTYAHPQCVGDLIAVSVDNRGAGGSTVTLYSAGRMLAVPSARPDWQVLSTFTFSEPMTQQGLSATQDVLFTGTRTTNALTWDGAMREVRLADLPRDTTPSVNWLDGWARGGSWRGLVADVTGDNKADLVVWSPGSDPATSPSTWQVATSDGTRFNPVGGEWARGWATGTYWQPFVADVTGDGKADLIVWKPGSDPARDPSSWQVATSDGTRFNPAGEWARGWATGAYWRPFVADVNGDGKADLIVWKPGSDPARDPSNWQVALSDGTRFNPIGGEWAHGWATGTYWRPFVADVNGDGRADLIVWNPGSDPARDPSNWQVALSDGTRFNPVGGEWAHGWATGAYWQGFVADVDGDRRADLVVWSPGSDPATNPSSWQVALSDGTRFNPVGGEWARGWATGTYWHPFVGDATGDSKADAIVWNPGGGSQLGSWQVAGSTGARFDASSPRALASVVDLSFP